MPDQTVKQYMEEKEYLNDSGEITATNSSYPFELKGGPDTGNIDLDSITFQDMRIRRIKHSEKFFIYVGITDPHQDEEEKSELFEAFLEELMERYDVAVEYHERYKFANEVTPKGIDKLVEAVRLYDDIVYSDGFSQAEEDVEESVSTLLAAKIDHLIDTA